MEELCEGTRFIKEKVETCKNILGGSGEEKSLEYFNKILSMIFISLCIRIFIKDQKYLLFCHYASTPRCRMGNVCSG